ncbi:MAG: GNAT family N-acetyltransferase [Saprospiraceae bacterium]|nr:GNAT family N-acetyltransferase [Candidatus Defluviibacterium haderslevense]
MNIETKSLLLRDFKASDKSELSKICSDLKLMKYVFDGPIKVNEFDTFIKKYFASSGKKIGLGTLCRKDINEVIGFAGLLPFKGKGKEDGIEFGFVINKPHWGNGFGTEIGKTLIKYGYETLNHSKLFATVHPENTASIKVLNKLKLVKIYPNIDIKDRGPRLVYSTITIESVEDTLKLICSYSNSDKKSEELKNRWDQILKGDDYKFPFPFGIWFRGHSRSEEYKLLPSIFRQDKDAKKHYRESALFNSFKLYNPSYNETHKDNLAWLTLMQHYDLPTRLLDWTENILIALYFAVKDSDSKTNENEESNGKLYILNSDRLNRITRMSQFENGLAIPTSIEPLLYSFIVSGKGKTGLLQQIHNFNLYEKIKIYNSAIIEWLYGGQEVEHKLIEEKMRYAVAVFPQRINARMQVQQSMFTIHGGKISTSVREGNQIGTPISLEELNELQGSDKEFLDYYIIPKEKKNKILNELKMIGIHQRSLYPDIDKQAEYLKKIWFLKSNN